MTARMTGSVLVLVIIMVLLCALAYAEGLEIGTVKPVMPDLTLALGISGSVQLFEFPTDWMLVGGRAAYMDLLYVDNTGFMGGSVQVAGKTRLGGTFWAEGGERNWSLYVVQPLIEF